MYTKQVFENIFLFLQRCLKRTEEFSPATQRNPQEFHPVFNPSSGPLSPEFPSKEENKKCFGLNKKPRECETTERKSEDDIAWSASGSSDEGTVTRERGWGD